MKDLFSSTRIALSETATKTADYDGATMDLIGYADNLVLVHVGEVGTAGGALDASNKWDLKLYHAPDDGTGSAGTWAIVPDEQLSVASGIDPADVGIFATIDAADEDVADYAVGYRGINRFVRVRYEATGSPGSTIFSSHLVQAVGRLNA